MPNWSQSFIIDTNASDTGIEAVLSQVDTQGVEHVVAYASRILTKAERNYYIMHWGLLAVVTFLQHFRQYLLGHPFTVCTDHGALTWLQGFKVSLHAGWKVTRVQLLHHPSFRQETP